VTYRIIYYSYDDAELKCDVKTAKEKERKEPVRYNYTTVLQAIYTELLCSIGGKFRNL
jgi:hypothetical protein